VVVDLRRGGDGRAGAAGERPLADGDGRADPQHLVDARLLHALEELAGVGRQALDVAALPLGVEGVEGQAALAGARDARDHHQLAGGDRDVDAFQVVDADSLEDDIGGHFNPTS
jgi:hypothetical protein